MPSSEVEAVRFLAVLLSLIVGCIPKSSLNGGDDDPDELHDALLLPGLEPKWRFHAAKEEKKFMYEYSLSQRRD